MLTFEETYLSNVYFYYLETEFFQITLSIYLVIICLLCDSNVYKISLKQ